MKAPLSTAAVLLALIASAGSGRAQGTSTAAPALNWTLPLFTDAGYHSMTLRGSEAHPISADRIDVTDINITVFSSDAAARVETSLLSPSATFFLRENRVIGSESVRVISFDDDGAVAAEITGEDWTYEQEGKKVSIQRHAHVVFQQTLSDILK